jgi:hypothetical protein
LRPEDNPQEGTGLFQIIDQEEGGQPNEKQGQEIAGQGQQRIKIDQVQPEEEGQ